MGGPKTAPHAPQRSGRRVQAEALRQDRVPVELLFAYGTLMRGYALHRVLARGTTYSGPGTCGGRCSIWAGIRGSSRDVAR